MHSDTEDSVFSNKYSNAEAHYSVENEGCRVLPVSETTADGLDQQRTLYRPRSVSLFDQTEDRQPLLKLQKITDSDEGDNVSEDLSKSDKKLLMVPAVTLPKISKLSLRFRKLNTALLEAVKHRGVQEIERLVQAGANPNATSGIDCVSACHLAALRTDGALEILLKAGANRKRVDRVGRTPLHLAAWAGNVKQVAILLGFSKKLQDRLDAGDIIDATENEVKHLTPDVIEFVNVKCDFCTNAALPTHWRDNTRDCHIKSLERNLPTFQLGWSALHAASARAQCHSARLLLAAGADLEARDLVGKTPLDVAGSAFYTDQVIDPQKFAELVTLLVGANSQKLTFKNKKIVDTPLHTAVELGSLEAVSVLVGAGMPVNWLNRAGMTPLHICVKKKLKEHLQILANHGYCDEEVPVAVDFKDKDGHTVLYKAILEGWAPGVCIAIEAGSSVTARDNNYDTPLHFAAMFGNVEILNEILNVAKHYDDVIDATNNRRETALFKAVINGHLECVKKLLDEGASITKSLPRQVNVFHIAAEKGYLDVLTVLLDHDYIITRRVINYLTADDKKGYGPIHFAVENNHPACVKILLSRNTYRSLRSSYGLQKGSTPLHIAAIHNNVDIAKILMKNNEHIVHIINDMGWTPLHTASHYGSRDMITLLLKEGADLSKATRGPNKCRTTAIDMIMNNLPKPTEFMENIFDTYISTNDLNLHDPDCEVTVNYKILVPKEDENIQMKVIDALLNTGNRYGQNRLLLHPLLESFLFLKWKALLPFFYTMLAFYAFFVLSLTTYIISVFFYKDTGNTAPLLLDTTGWAVIMYITIVTVMLQEVLYMNVSNGYFLRLETWIKFSSVCLAAILPYVTQIKVDKELDWPRHVATTALLLSWLEMMFLLSRFPNWGYYVLMFGKVSTNVIKILLTFAFLVIGFALSFMIQFHSQKPFESPWAALVKTIVMMTSEFDYGDLVKEKDSKKFVTSLLVVRVIFLIFLILAAIVLMNLMVGVAVNDLHNLRVLGNVRRLGKQVEFLGSLEHLVYNRILTKILPTQLEEMLKRKKKICSTFVLSPSVPKSKCYRSLPSRIREAIFEKAQFRKKQRDDELGSQNYKKKLDEIYRATVKLKKDNNTKTDRYITNKSIKDAAGNIAKLDTAIIEIKNQTKLEINQIKASIDTLNNKIDMILNKLSN